MPSFFSLNTSKTRKKKKNFNRFAFKQKVDLMSLKVNTEMSTQNGEMLHRDTPACSFMILPYNRANVKGCCVQQALLANELSSELHIDYLPCWEEKTTPQSLKTKAKQKTNQQQANKKRHGPYQQESCHCLQQTFNLESSNLT